MVRIVGGASMVKKRISLSIRLDLPNGSRFGPGKAELLRAIEETGSISAAAKTLNMSYPRALRLVNDMNSQFLKPLIEKFQGGAARGGATLTPAGRKILSTYTEISDGAAHMASQQINKISDLYST